MARIKSKTEQLVEQDPATNGHAEVPVARLAPPPKKTKCPISRAEFVAKAAVLSLKATEGDVQVAHVLCPPKEFSTRSFGWGYNDKLTILVGGKPVKVQATINLTVVGSKEAD